MKIRDVEFLVRCMQVVVGQTEPHQNCRNFQVALKVSDDRNGTTRTDENCLLREHPVKCMGGRLNVAIICTHDDRLPGMNEPDLQVNSLRLQRLNIALVLAEGLL